MKKDTCLPTKGDHVNQTSPQNKTNTLEICQMEHHYSSKMDNTNNYTREVTNEKQQT